MPCLLLFTSLLSLAQFDPTRGPELRSSAIIEMRIILQDPLSLADSLRHEIEHAFQRADLPRLRAARALLERGVTRWPEAGLLLHYLGYALYREALLVEREVGPGDILGLLERAEGILEESLALEPIPETRALISAVIGQRIRGSRLRGIRFGPKADEWLELARAEAPENPRVWLIGGIGSIFRPRLFGGGLERAEAEIRRAIELFETDDPSAPLPRWGEGEAWFWLGQILRHEGRVEEARAAFQRALDLEPEDYWAGRALNASIPERE